jgi:tripartite-type tricarboxylate transporter receptor subunit TctC
MQHVPYKGASPVVTDLMGGQIQLAFIPPMVVLPQIKAGRVKAIAYTGETRLPELGQVPTFAESGMPGFDVKAWLGFFVPPLTPKEIIDKLSTEIAKIVAMPDIKESLARQGMEPFAAPPDKFAAVIRADIAKWGDIIKTANVKIEK